MVPGLLGDVTKESMLRFTDSQSNLSLPRCMNSLVQCQCHVLLRHNKHEAKHRYYVLDTINSPLWA